jgi:hypothetical protein
MAYNLRYYIPWSSRETKGYVYIYQYNGTDPSEGLILSRDGIVINTTFNDWGEPVIQQNAQITFINDKENFFDLLPLLSSEEREYKIKIVETEPSSHIYFEGYINTDVIEETYIEKAPINLVASNYIGKLDYVNPSRIEELTTSSLIDTISDTLKLTGGDSSIFVNLTLCPSGATKQSNNSALNLCSLDNELFWVDNVKRDSGLNILNKVLKPFDSYLYWWDGNYYIERYSDLWKYPQKYVRYKTDASYGYSNYGTNINRYDVSHNIYDYNHLNVRQTMSFIPGLNKIEISLNPANYNSLVKNYWDPIIDSSAELTLPQPYGSWLHWEEIIGMFGGYPIYSTYFNTGPYKTISNTFYRSGYPIYKGSLGIEDPCTHGAWTSFRMTVPPESEGTTNLNLSWKWAPESINKTTTYRLGYLVEIRLHEGAGGLYLKEDKNSGVWYTTSRKPGLNTVDVDGSTLESPFVKEMSVSIPMLDISTSSFTSLAGDYTMIFTICPTRYNSSGTYVGLNTEYFGDVTVQVSQPEDDNLITGIINNKFLNKKTIDLDLYDINNFNQRNGLWTFAGSAQRHTSYWYDDTSTYHTLIDKLMISKWKLYEKTRQSISSAIRTTEYLKPLSAWYDSKQPNKKYVLVEYNFLPTRNEYSCVWNEFNNDTSVNLNNV